MMFYVDAFIYLCLTFYIEALFPGEYGIPEKWYFPITSSYWFGEKQNFDIKTIGFNQNKEFFEAEPTDLRVGIKIINLFKTFDEKNFVVKNLNLNAYSGQITGLLGHNGAGLSSLHQILKILILFEMFREDHNDVNTDRTFSSIQRNSDCQRIRHHA